jgi:cytoskeleton protein RodZ
MTEERSADTPVEDAAPPAAARTTFGAVLAAERERQGISVADIAGRLRLHPKQLAAIESEDFSALPTAPFLRGFVRNYAKELRIDATPLLAELTQRLAPKSPDPSGTGNGSGPRIGAGDRLPRALVIGAAVAALAVFGIIGVLSSRDASNAPATRAAAPAAAGMAGTPASSVAPAAPGGVASAPAATDSGASPSASSATPGTVPAAAGAAAGGAGAPGAAAAMTESKSPAPASAATSTAPVRTPPAAAGAAALSASTPASPGPTASAAPAAAATASAPAAAAPAVARTGTIVRSVRLSFNDAAWVRIEDAEGKILLSQVNEAGTEQRVAGKSPLRLIIGNASNVTLDVAGREIDLRPRTSADNVARVTVE